MIHQNECDTAHDTPSNNNACTVPSLRAWHAEHVTFNFWLKRQVSQMLCCHWVLLVTHNCTKLCHRNDCQVDGTMHMETESNGVNLNWHLTQQLAEEAVNIASPTSPSGTCFSILCLISKLRTQTRIRPNGHQSHWVISDPVQDHRHHLKSSDPALGSQDLDKTHPFLTFQVWLLRVWCLCRPLFETSDPFQTQSFDASCLPQHGSKSSTCSYQLWQLASW